MRRSAVIAVAAIAAIVFAALLLYRTKQKSLDELIAKAKRGAAIELRVAGLSEGYVPRKYTCDGEDISPMVEWGQLPHGTRSLALICFDPDAPRGTFVHWVLFNIPPGIGRISEGVPRTGSVSGVGLQGMNDFGRIGYGGPCPPSGTHRYVFLLLALDEELDLKEGVDASTLLSRAIPHVIGYGEVVLKYSRG